MRRDLVFPSSSSLLLGVCLLTACNEAAYPSFGEPGDDPAGGMFTVSGVVTDSLSGAVLPGATVVSGRYLTDADAEGRWSLTLPAGAVTVSTGPTGYERSAITLDLRTNAFITFKTRRLAPLVRACEREGQYVRAQVLDLQGRKTVERWQRSEAFVLDPAGTYRIGAPAWYYRAVDYITWEVTIGPVAAETATIRWNVYDAEGHGYAGICEPGVTAPGD